MRFKWGRICAMMDWTGLVELGYGFGWRIGMEIFIHGCMVVPR